MNYYAEVFNKYATFTGRARRKEYWTFLLVNLVIILVVQIFIVSTKNTSHSVAIVLVLSYVAYCLILILPSIAVIVRRLHDTGRSGWWYFISVVPIIGGVWLLVLMCLDSTPGENEYGPNPKGIGAPQMAQAQVPPAGPTV